MMAPVKGSLTEKSLLRDSHGRVMRKVRISLTEACNYRCFYCMPENIVFPKQSEYLSPDEFLNITQKLVNLGIEQVRVTGGEPTVRTDFVSIMEKLGTLHTTSDIKLGLTSNGQTTYKYLDVLESVGCKHLNISMDSLDNGKFERITRGGDLNKVLKTIYMARDRGFEVKVNAIVFKGINDDELLRFHDWSAEEKVEVRFLEFMKIGPAHVQNENRFMSADEMITRLETHTDLIHVQVESDSTSFVYSSSAGAKLGFIASETKPFCGTCSRLRLSAKGVLRACLMSEDGVSIRRFADEEDADDNFAGLVQDVIQMKPTGRIHHIDQPMHQIGG